MVFSSALFVFLFLPLVLAAYFGLPRGLRNTVLLAASLWFYAWGEPVMVAVMLVSIAANWSFGLAADRTLAPRRRRLVVAAAVAFNLALLVAFKYADWLWNGAGELLAAIGWRSAAWPPIGTWIAADSALSQALLDEDGGIRLPVGISFYTFQALSYVVDVHRRDVAVQRSPFHVALYIALFPQLIAGPIVRYRDVAQQIVARFVSLEGFAQGVRRFVIGLGKKVLIANVCAQCADKLFGAAGVAGVPIAELTTPVAWVGVLAYTIQVYFDFSGYSDMAIGLGRMLGFEFLENFAHPYISRSVTELWRRWHISLSSWFRDYLYIPLGGSRGTPARTYFNLLTVFGLCGLWHGAAVTYLVWGLFNGLFLVIERAGRFPMLERRVPWLGHVYVLLVWMVGLVIFRSDSLTQAGGILGALSGFPSGGQLVPVGDLLVEASRIHHVGSYASALTWLAIGCGAIGSTPWLPRLVAWHATLAAGGRPRLALGLEVAAHAGLALVFLAVAMELAAGAYNPFIYFRF